VAGAGVGGEIIVDAMCRCAVGWDDFNNNKTLTSHTHPEPARITVQHANHSFRIQAPVDSEREHKI
jgi:hypothetical protein